MAGLTDQQVQERQPHDLHPNASLSISHRFEPLTITAHLQQGVALDVLFGTALDGLMASVVRARAKAAAAAQGRLLTGSMLDGGLDLDEPAVVDLPLARCSTSTHAQASERASEPASANAYLAEDPDWHWLCTTAFPVGLDGARTCSDPDVHHEHSRMRETILRHISSPLPASLPPASGRYRMRRLPIVTTPAAAVQWNAVGDHAAVLDLISDLPAIGRRRSSGEGLVLRWEVTAHPHLPRDQWARHGHSHPDGTLGRPVPRSCLDRVDIHADRQGVAGIRPPYWHPATQRSVFLPDPL